MPLPAIETLKHQKQQQLLRITKATNMRLHIDQCGLVSKEWHQDAHQPVTQLA
jgi:predicted ribonuclease YlaK